MSVSERSRHRVQDAIDRLEGEFGDFEVIDRHWDCDREGYEALAARAADTLGGAGAWVTNDEGEVLLVRREDSPDAWSEPSGHHEPGERLAETARREVREETGVDVSLTGVGFVQHVRNHPPEGDPIHRAIVVFTAAHREGEPRPEAGEIAAAEWWADHPDRLLYDALRRLPVPAAD